MAYVFRLCFGGIGVTRRSVLELAREWEALEGGEALEVVERRLAMGEIVKASDEGRVSKLSIY